MGERHHRTTATSSANTHLSRLPLVIARKGRGDGELGGVVGAHDEDEAAVCRERLHPLVEGEERVRQREQRGAVLGGGSLDAEQR